MNERGQNYLRNIFLKNKRGQEGGSNVVGILIAIILGILIMVVLIIGFTKGWSTFLPYLGQSNVQTIQTQCSAACSTSAGSSSFDYCTNTFTLNNGSASLYGMTCNYLANGPGMQKYGIAACPAVSCPNVVILPPYTGTIPATHGQELNTLQSLLKTNSCTSATSGQTVEQLMGNYLVSVQC